MDKGLKNYTKERGNNQSMVKMLFGPIDDPRGKFLFNVFWFFWIISFLYFMRYESGIEFDLESESKLTQESLENGRKLSAFKHYGVYLLFFIWQYRKWITHGRVNSLRTQETTCECKTVFQANKLNCPKCQIANPLMQETKPKKAVSANVDPVKNEPKNKDKIDPNSASFKGKENLLEDFIRAN